MNTIPDEFGEPDDESPEWTAEDFARSRRGAPWANRLSTPRGRAETLDTVLERLKLATRELEALESLPSRDHGRIESALLAVREATERLTEIQHKS